MATLETILSKISCGKQMEIIISFSGVSTNSDELMGAIAGLGRHETNYLFWSYLGSGKMHMKATLISESTKFLNSNKSKINPKQQASIVQLVLAGLCSTLTRHCSACGGTGNKEGLCQVCFGTGRLNISQRQIARELEIPWATYHKNKALNELLSHLLSFCAILEGNIKRHVHKRLNDDGF